MTSPLNFEDLLHMAAGNAMKGEKKIKKQESQISVNKVKKQDPKEKKLSEGVQKFLQQKALEEKRQAEEKRKQKEKLIALRSQDKKANKRVNSMLRMTKSANKACIADAKNSFSDALAGQDEQQPDEDDYGYVSQSSQEWHKKLLDKYRQIPASKPTRRGIPVNVPVPQTLSKSKSKSGQPDEDEFRDAKQSTDNDSNKLNNSVNNNKPKKRLPPPDPMNFQALLELANQKSQEPVNFCKPLKQPAKMEKETFEFGRPMTAKEKAAHLQEKALKEKIQSGNITLPPIDSRPSNSARQISQSQSIPSRGAEFKIPSTKKKEANGKFEPPSREDKTVIKQPSKRPPSPPSSRNNLKPPSIPKTTSVPQRRSPPPSNSRILSNNSKLHSSNNSRPSPPRNNSRIPPSNNSRSSSPPRNNSRMPPPNNSRMLPSNNSRSSSPPRNNSRMPPPNNSRVQSNNNQCSRSPPYNHSRMPPPRPRHPPPQKRNHRVIESDDEYDSEMDDFIADDEEEGGINYSDMIRALTGYDRNKYKHIDEDDIQESSVHEQWQEERRSAIIGKLEDDEEERKEAEERRRKMSMKKKMRR